MSKLLNIVLIGLFSAAFFMLKDELDKAKRSIDTINAVTQKLEALENRLDKLNVLFDNEHKENERFKKATTTFMLNTVDRLHGEK